MTDELQAIARRAITSQHWRWSGGMLTTRGVRISNVSDGGSIAGMGLTGYVERSPYPDELPDLGDPATLGCLLALVRRAWGDKALSAHFIGWLDLWEMIPMDDRRRPLGQLCGSCEAESLVLCLEAAP